MVDLRKGVGLGQWWLRYNAWRRGCSDLWLGLFNGRRWLLHLFGLHTEDGVADRNNRLVGQANRARDRRRVDNCAIRLTHVFNPRLGRR